MALTSFNTPIEAAEPITKFEADYHQWAFDTAAAIEQRQFARVDWDNVVEELRSLGKSEERELQSRLSQLMYHLLKLQYQPERKSRSWQKTITNQKAQISDLVTDQPSLQPRLVNPELWRRAYRDVWMLATSDNLPDSVVEKFSEECPFDISILS